MDYQSWIWLLLEALLSQAKVRIPSIHSAYWIAIHYYILKLVIRVFKDIPQRLNYPIYLHWRELISDYCILFLHALVRAIFIYKVKEIFVKIKYRSSQTQDPDLGNWCIWLLRCSKDGEYGMMTPLRIDLPELVSIELGDGSLQYTNNLTMRSTNSNLVLN